MSSPHKVVPPTPFTEEALAKAQKWLDDNIARGARAPFSDFFDLSPEMAWCLLGRNPDNRAQKFYPLRNLISDIANGRWRMNGETIIVSDTGYVNDGQHRCMATVITGVTIQTGISFGLERDSRYTVDMGAARTAGDIMSQNGVKNPNRKAAVINLYQTFNSGFYGVPRVLSKQNVIDDFYTHERKIDEAFDKVAHSAFVKSYGPVALLTAYMLIAERAKSIVKVDEFFHGLLTGEQLVAGDARLQLRAHLIKATQEKFQSHEKLEIILRYWNLFRLGKVVKASSPLLGVYPEIRR